MKMFHIFLFSMISLAVTAQEAVKIPLLEHFTNSRCPICANRNPGFHDLRKSFGDEVNHIAYHPKYPYPSCEFYQHNKEGNQSRADHYNISGTPTVYLDGNEGNGSQLVQRSAIEQSIQQLSFFELALTEERNGDQVTVNLDITTKGQVPANTTYRLYAATVEEIVDYQAPNGEDTHYNVFREFSSAREGNVISPAPDGMTVSYSFQYTMDGEWNAEKIYSIGFIQNDNDGSIENSAASTVNTSSSSDQNIAELSVFPNPSSEKLYLGAEIESYQLYDLNGKLMLSQFSNVLDRTINLSGLNEGVYILQFIKEGKRGVKKIMVGD